MRLYAFAFFASCLLVSSVFAERFGSQTNVTLKGAYYFTGTTSIQPLPNGDTRDTETHTVVTVTNATILQAMKNRSLIPSTSGYQLVMVAHAHMADGIRWFAIKGTGEPVAVPTDIFDLSVNDGPVNGQFTVDNNAALKSLSQQTHNSATITQGDFSGTSVLSQTWKSKAVKNGALTDAVELVTTNGTFNGTINTGIGMIDFQLTGAKTVDLTRFGMASLTNLPGNGSNGSSAEAGTITTGFSGSGSITLSGNNTYSGSTTINSGTLVLGTIPTFSGGITITGGLINASNGSFAIISTLTINTTTGGSATGLVVDADGNVTQFPTFGNSLPGTLVIITFSGTHTYTHDADDVWTLVTP